MPTTRNNDSESLEAAIVRERRRVVTDNALRSLIGFFVVVGYVAVVEWLTRPSHRSALLIVGTLYVIISAVCLLLLRYFPQRAVPIAVVGVNAISAAMLGYSPMVHGGGELCVLALNILLGGFAVMFPLGLQNQLLASIVAVIGYPIVLQLGTSTAYPAWYSASALAVFLFVLGVGARAIDRYRSRILSDTQQQAALAADNEALMQEAQNADRTKSDLVVTLSHELRIPLSNILESSEMVLTGGYDDTSEQRHAIERIRDQSWRMLDLMQAMLDVDQMGSGQFRVDVEQFDVIDLLDRVREDLPHGWRRPGVQVRWYTPLRGVEMRGDRKKLEVILRNLIHNALKYTAAGVVSVTATQETKQNSVRFTVSDSGEGILAEDLPHVFERFRQGRGSSRQDGAGLGLFIVRRFTDTLHGSVHVESTRGVGTKVDLVLPLVHPSIEEESLHDESAVA